MTNTGKHLSKIAAIALTGAVAVASMTACKSKDDAGSGSSGDDSTSSSSSSGGDDNSGGDSTPSKDLTVTLTKNGGYPGMHLRLDIKANGKWSYSKNKMVPKTGKLSADDQKKLAELASDSKLADSKTPKSDKSCSDIPVYNLKVTGGDDKVDVSTGTCGEMPTKSFKEIVKLLGDSTPM
ncbi:MAG TPA: hypothetical protein VE172_03590 [Stackebrandtia sp.]|jgi:hypothetical protein|uniref:hypothetical protein n=1 Tax=Stackebrandtia sp. TaxID=2023065 RepID=UPI002D6E4668|nr:hypothetical protein [Stackebrandtia sp.]HZE37871.1 hypothetical protein [Stackebrandtia sp.]